MSSTDDFEDSKAFHAEEERLSLEWQIEQAKTQLAETRRELEEWKATAKALWRGVMAEDDDQILQDAMMKASRLIEAEKGGAS